MTMNNVDKTSKQYSARHRSTQRAIAAALTATLCAGGVPTVAFASSSDNVSAGDVGKTQVVYVKADAAGEQEGVYVVNQFEFVGQGEGEKGDGASSATVSDVGDYLSVVNLTDSQDFPAQGTSRFTVKEGSPFLYQGNLSSETELPWKVSVSYGLDGESVSPDKLAGATGSLEMTMELEPNDACVGNWADNYLVQVSALLDNDLASNISADGATIAQESGATKLSYMVFPGKSASYTVRADVREFEFDGWQVVGVPLSIALNIDDGQIDGAASSLDELEDALASINSGSQELNYSLAQFALAGDSLAFGSQQYAGALSSQATALQGAAASVDVASAQAAYQQALQTYAGAFAQAFAQAYVQTGSSEQAQELADKATANQQQALASATTAFVTAQATQAGNESAASALQGALDGYSDLGKGVSSYVAAASSLASGASQLASGTQMAANKTQGMAGKMVDEVRDKLTEYLNPSFELTDFVNGSTENIENVQFVITTEAIEIPNVDNTVVEEQPKQGFFEKFLALFGVR